MEEMRERSNLGEDLGRRNGDVREMGCKGEGGGRGGGRRRRRRRRERRQKKKAEKKKTKKRIEKEEFR